MGCMDVNAKQSGTRVFNNDERVLLLVVFDCAYAYCIAIVNMFMVCVCVCACACACACACVCVRVCVCVHAPSLACYKTHTSLISLQSIVLRKLEY